MYFTVLCHSYSPLYLFLERRTKELISQERFERKKTRAEKMAKGLRAKSRRKARAEFRSTIGKDAEEKRMEVIQAKLTESIEKGGMNSLERLSSLLDGSTTSSLGFPSNSTTMQMNDDDDKMVISSSGSGKDASKIPIRKSSRKKIQLIPNVQGQSGSRLAKKIIGKAKRRGQIKKGNWVPNTKKHSTRKAKNNVSF